MELIVTNKILSISGSSTVKDVSGNDVFEVKGVFISFTRKKFINDKAGKNIFTVQNKYFTFIEKRAVILDPRGSVVAEVIRKTFSLHDHYYIASSLGDLQIRGNILGFDYHVTLNGREIGHIARRISIIDSFVLTVEEGFDPALFVAIVIAIDLITDRRRGEAANYN